MAPRRVPYEFIFDHLEPAEPHTKPMFGHTAVYVGERIVLFLIERQGNPDSGICLATSAEHLESLRREFPSAGPLHAYPDSTGWLLLPATAEDFEESALRACRLIVRRDPRIGRAPKGSRRRIVARKKGKKKVR